MGEKKIYDYLINEINTESFAEKIKLREPVGFTTKYIADKFGIYRSNASAILNKLVKDGVLIKTSGRPVRFLPAKIFLKLPSDKSTFTLKELSEIHAVSGDQNRALAAGIVEMDPFSVMIGSDGSLSEQINQAKAAILYPPHGLHTLIVGESGTGKTIFSKAMYNYGLAAKGRSAEDYPYVAFNCADYYNNPQLLMSHLFGYVKGAFTGADKETSGMVEKADGGILFLDEIHRLPPEGQELLFYLMDTGNYRKLGESGRLRTANIQIIGATTESPENVLLETFKRRIPLTIRLASFRERPVHEKIRAVESFFIAESAVVKRGFILKAPIVKALASYEYKGNMGQLASEIKVLCARTFLSSPRQDPVMTVQYQYLSVSIRDNYRKIAAITNFESKYDYDITIKPDRSIQYSFGHEFDEFVYRRLIDNINYHTGLHSTESLPDNIREYYSHVLNRFDSNKIDHSAMYKTVDRNVVDFAERVLSIAENELDITLSQKNILVLAFHIKFLLERIENSAGQPPEKTVSNSKIEKDFPKELAAAAAMVADIRLHFSVEIPANEKYIIAILLANMKRELRVKSKLYILAHGNSTASSIAEVCCKLMSCDFVHGIDAPLEQSVSETYKRFIQELQFNTPKDGIIILADMGSLLGMGEKASKELGIPVFTIPNVTTITAIDITRMLCRNDNAREIYEEYVSRNKAVPVADKKGDIIITYCASGAGTGKAFKAVIEEELNNAGLNDVVIYTLTHRDINDKTQQYAALEKDYNILAFVGNMENSSNIPFFHITDLLTPEGKHYFINFVKGRGAQNFPDLCADDDELLKNKSRAFLSKHAACINPDMAVDYAIRYIDAVNMDIINDNQSLKLSFILHVGFMLERNIIGLKVRFDSMEGYIYDNKDQFDLFKKHISILEKPFQVVINDSEICFLVKTIKNKNGS